MKKIYMILAAITLLSMSLNAQRLPAELPGGLSFSPNGKATLVNHNKGQFRMPTLGSDEYLLGPYITDDFDATGIGYSGYYNAAQKILTTVELDRSEWESHLGDTIIGFRFALAGTTATRVYDFQALPYYGSVWDTDNQHIWSLGDLMSGNTTTTTQTVTAHNAITIYIANGNLSFRRIAVEKADGTTVTEWTYSANGANLPNNNWSCTASFIDQNGWCWISGGGTITISANELAGVTDPVRVVINAKTDSWYYNSCAVTVNGNDSQTITNYNTWNNYTWNYINPTTQTLTVNTVDVGRGASKHEHLPVSGYNQDYGYQNQMIYRAGQLCMGNGAQITSLTFYPEPGQGIPFSGSTVKVYLANTSTDNYGTGDTGNKITSGLTQVATIEPVADYDATAWTINFNTPFTYTGGNLLVQMECPGAGQYAHTFFLGDDQSANVSLTAVGRSGISSSTGNTSKFLPKATFTFNGTVNDPEYLTLAGGEWHDFFLNEPVVFNVMSDDVNKLLIGYSYYQQNSSSHTPTAVNSNSTGHNHMSYMYARTSSSSSYEQRWWGDGISGSDNTDRPGDLAVQLIFKKKKEKTPTPEITYTYDNGTYYITATATGDNADNAEVTMTVNGTTVTGTHSVTVEVGRGGTDYNVTAVASAIEPDKLVSDEATENITILASELDPTPTPSFTSEVHDLTVQVTGSGEGDVHMYITWPNGNVREVSYPDYYLERGTEDYYVTVTVTAQTENHYMSSYTGTVLVPKLGNLDELIDGWIELPGTYDNNKVINWNDNLMFVDRFTASTADNNHPAKYIYKMTENKEKLIQPLRNTNEHIIPVQLTRSKVHGYFTEEDVLADRDRQHVDTCVMNANVEMYLENSSDIYYYTLDRSRNSIVDEYFLELSNLQNDGSHYVEMDDYFKPKFEPYDFGTIHRLDSINTMLPASAPQGVKGKHYGEYHNDYIAYVPIIWTFGNYDANKRAFWDRDHKHNSYGSPIWKTGVGKIEYAARPQLERQKGKDGSTNWNEYVTNGNVTDTIPCSLYMVKSLVVDGFLPDTAVSNIKYEPYMFRVWVTSPTGKLRTFSKVAGDGVHTGEHYVGTGTIPANTPYWLWDEAIADSTEAVTFPTTFKTRFTFSKSEEWDDEDEWALPEEVNMIFAAPDDITANDIKVIVRFYYKSTGEALHQNAQPQQGNGSMLMVNRDGSNGYYGVEEPGDPDPNIPTFIKGIYDMTNGHGEVIGVSYFNLQGMQSDKPFDGVNIVITRYSNGTVSTTKVVR